MGSSAELRVRHPGYRLSHRCYASVAFRSPEQREDGRWDVTLFTRLPRGQWRHQECHWPRSKLARHRYPQSGLRRRPNRPPPPRRALNKLLNRPRRRRRSASRQLFALAPTKGKSSANAGTRIVQNRTATYKVPCASNLRLIGSSPPPCEFVADDSGLMDRLHDLVALQTFLPALGAEA